MHKLARFVKQIQWAVEAVVLCQDHFSCFQKVKMNKGGRSQDTVWEHFLRVDVGGKTYARCKICGNQQANKASRLRAHYTKCASSVETDKVTRDARDDIAPGKRSRSPSPPPAKRQAVSAAVSVTQHDVSGFLIKTTDNQKSLFDLEIAKLFYACNLPFSVAEHPQFLRVLQLIRTGYKPPTRKAIGSNLLDTVTDQLQEDMRTAIAGKSATLVQDGWSNCHNEPVVASCLQTSSK